MTSPAPGRGDFPPGETLRAWVDDLIGADEARAAAAFTSLDRACRPLLVAAAQTLAGEVTKAEDVVQDVLMALWAKRRRLRIEGQVRSYLLAAIHHRGLNALRWHGRVEELPEEVGEAETGNRPTYPSGLLGPEEEFYDLELLEWLERALEGLSDKRRQAVLLKCRGLTNVEIAEFMGISSGAAGVLILRARRDLHAFMGWLHNQTEAV